MKETFLGKSLFIWVKLKMYVDIKCKGVIILIYFTKEIKGEYRK